MTKDPEYASVRDDLQALRPDSPGQVGAGLLLAEMALGGARKLRDNPTARAAQTVADGYSIAWETRLGIVGLWSCWMRDGLYLGWPCAAGELPPERVLRAFPGSTHEGRFQKEYGRYVGTYTVPLPESGETTSLEVGFCSNQRSFYRLDGKKLDQRHPPGVAYGHDYSGFRLFTEPGWRPEGTSYDEASREWYEAQEPRFLALGCDLANENGVSAVTVELGCDVNFQVVPENLAPMGFETEWVRGRPGTRQGWGSEAVYGSRTLSDGRVEEVMLISANSLVPWVCYRRQPVPNGRVTPEFVREMLTF